MTTAAPVEEAIFQLKKTMTLEGDELGVTQSWMWEADRWKELVFALLTKATNASDAEVRLVTEQIAELDLIAVDKLAALSHSTQADRMGVPRPRRIIEIMLAGGFTEDEAENGLSIVIEAAAGLQEHYDGKVQRYLRHYGELMLDQIDNSFSFTALDHEAVADAFTYWLQNVLNMPLSLIDDSVQRYAKMIGVTPAELVAAADEIDMNLAMVDDLCDLHVSAVDEGAVDV